MAYNYYSYKFNDKRFKYCRITKNGCNYEQAMQFLENCLPGNAYYDYGTKNCNLHKLLDKMPNYSTLHIKKLNDLGYLVSDVLSILELLYAKNTFLCINNNYMVKIDAICNYIENHFNKDWFINFDKYEFKDELEGEIK